MLNCTVVPNLSPNYIKLFYRLHPKNYLMDCIPVCFYKSVVYILHHWRKVLIVFSNACYMFQSLTYLQV